MVRRILDLPRSLMRVMSIDWQIDVRGEGLGETSAGLSQTVYSQFPRWVGQPRLSLRRSDVLPFRALLAELQGRINMLRVPMIDPLAAPFATWAGAYASGIPFDTGESFDTGFGFAFEPTALAVGDLPMGATEITLDTAPCGVAIVQGQILSAGDWPFMVTSVTEVSGSEFTLRIRPGLRVAVADGDEVHMEGRGLFEVTGDLAGNPAYSQSQRSGVDLALREVLVR